MGKDNNKAAITRRIGRILDELKWELSKMDKVPEAFQQFMESLELLKDGKAEPKIKPIALYLDIIEMIRGQSALTSTFPSLVHNAEVIYDSLFMFGEDTPDFDKTVEIFKILAGENGLVVKGFFDPFFFASFGDKSQYLTVIQIIAGQKNSLQIFKAVKGHALEVRQYLAEETAYVTYLIRIVKRLSELGTDAYEPVLEEELLRIRRSNGIYDIDPVRLAQVEKNVHSAELTVESGKALLQLLERRSREMEQFSRNMTAQAKETMEDTEVYLQTKVDNARGSLDAVLKEYEETQKQSIHLEKELFLKQLLSEAETELNKYQSLAKSITATTATEISKLGRDADEVIRRLKNAAGNDAKLKEFSEKTKQDEELLQKIQKLTILNDTMLERFGAQFGVADPALQAAGVVLGEGTGAVPGMPMPGAVPPEAPMPGEVSEGGAFGAVSGIMPGAMPVGAGYMPMPGVGIPGAQIPGGPMWPTPPAHIKKGQRDLPEVNPMLDMRVPFKERFDLAMKEKKRRIAQGELFHEMFDDVLTAVMEDVNPYLIGPSGCGKTFMVKQISEILKLDFSDIGYINEEYDILGYVTAMGEYSESNFYWLYKYGGMAFCDELDNGNSKATVKLNSFLSNQRDASYCFPGGERVDKHPNFRIIAAGNTAGGGADINYSTREKIEESVMQRMIPIYIDYDNRVEKEILRRYPNWYEFACAFREATDRWGEVSGNPAQGIFTTRDAFRVRQYLDSGSYTPEKIITYEFVQTKEPEYLAFLKDELYKTLRESIQAMEIYKLFAAEADRVIKRGKRG